jgi:cell division septal protein FtsQ
MNHEVETPQERSWRDVRQSVNPRAMTTHGRRRLGWSVVRTCTLVLVCGGFVAVGLLWAVGGGFDSPTSTIAPVVKAEPLREIVVLTDGVLNEEWVTAWLALPPDIALMAVGLEAARERLESAGQIRHAVVARDFPGTLAVTLEERTPVVRMMVPLDPRKPEALLVARDGVVYRGANYDQAMLERLPWLDGVRLTRSGEEVLPIEGMDRVSELLLAGMQDAPHLARTWQIISLVEAPRLIVRTANVREIVFEPANFRRQFARLDYLLDLYREQGVPRDGIARLDVSIPSQVVVSFASGAAPRRERP